MDVIYKLNDKQIEDLQQLYQKEWWTKGRSFKETKLGVEGSQICVGIVDSSGKLQGFARVLTDYIFKAIIFDVIVSENQRGIGLGNKLLDLIKNHEDLTRVKHFELYCLPEMCGYYERHGFSGNIGEIKLMRHAISYENSAIRKTRRIYSNHELL